MRAKLFAKSASACIFESDNVFDGRHFGFHVKPALGNRSLQKLQSTEIDTLYARLGDTRTARQVHSVLGACLGTAERTRKITRSPTRDVIKVPSPGEPDHGMALDSDQLRTL